MKLQLARLLWRNSEWQGRRLSRHCSPGPGLELTTYGPCGPVRLHWQGKCPVVAHQGGTYAGRGLTNHPHGPHPVFTYMVQMDDPAKWDAGILLQASSVPSRTSVRSSNSCFARSCRSPTDPSLDALALLQIIDWFHCVSEAADRFVDNLITAYSPLRSPGRLIQPP